MKIITSHERADMDSLASMYAASLLHPGYQAVLPYKLNRNLRDFLALYRDELPFVEHRSLPVRHISALILTDTQAIAPLRGMDAQTRLHIVDHHLPERPAADNVTFHGEPVGATTTLLLEEIHRQGMTLSKIGATLLLLGIYEDTGSLSYATTTARDAQAAAWLLEQGADLAILNQFLNHPLTTLQREALTRLIVSATMHTIKSRSVCVAGIVLDTYVDELSSLIHQLVDVYEPDACFLLAQFEGTIQVIARSTTDAINVADLLREFGGGGHSKAAAALVEDDGLAQLTARLLRALQQHTEPPVLVREIMSTNVHTLDPNISVREAAQLMQRYGHEGFPVVDEERLVGILIRRDVDRALHHRLGDTPVRTFLYTGAVFVRPDDAVDEVQRVMIEHDLGQVPVVEDGRFVGIVTRTDLIKLFAPALHPSRAQELRRLMESALPDPLRDLLVHARDTANDLGYSLYIVGGFVRDLLLGTPNLDLDLVVEGDALLLARELSKVIGGRVRSHARFGTAKIVLDGERGAGIPAALDFVTARTEFYERPSVLPQVERSSIKQDLYRRDFTINTLAICLDRDRYGELLDFYGGERDIREKRIRVLHNLSFVEDPTRILRAVRFEQRLGFEIEERTANLIGDALDLLNHVTGERLRHEFYLLLSEAEPERGLEKLEQIGALAKLHPALHYSRDMSQRFVRLRQRFAAWPATQDSHIPASDPLLPAEMEAEGEISAPALGLCYLALLTSSMNTEELVSLGQRLRITHSDSRLLQEVMQLRGSLDQLRAKAMLPSTIYRLLSPYSREARFVLSVLTESEAVRQRLDLYEQQLSMVVPQIDGHYLRALGVPPGPVYGEILERIRSALLDGQILTLADEQALAQRLVTASL
jgi:tRNA nucleotidyltransferase (CCA-adding enzyme)